MKLVLKQPIPGTKANSNGSTKGGYLFEIMDVAGVTMLNETFANIVPDNYSLVTNRADVKYIASVFVHEYIEVFAEITDITPASVTVGIVLNNRNRNSTEWTTAVTGSFSFSMIDTNTRKIVRIPREVINVNKG